ncbi:putative secreted protein [Rhodopirellula maiorica SM1]|uniref:Putative secreted protein n=1 Tax=Rhodopirellula maiorica SM1 TaxID=1265738 RepID=M5RHP6_9BACT|nr:putative secreted protein [Rhodopirellula maiorica]EMI18805.1 putative secreted protein [Rhodopirellula maiorica SM1]
MKRIRSQISIRIMLLLTAVIAVVLAYYANGLRKRKVAMQTVVSLGGSGDGPLEGSEWLRYLLDDDDFFREISRLSVSYDTTNYDVKRPIGDIELAAAIDCLPSPNRLNVLRLDGSAVSDDGLYCLKVLSNLESLSLRKTLITDAGLQRITHCVKLKELNLSQTAIDGRGLRSLARLQQLEQLDLSHTRVTEYELLHLPELKNLQGLDLAGTPFLGGGFRFLVAKLPNLEKLDLYGTEIGKNGTAARYFQRYAEKLICLRELSLARTQITGGPSISTTLSFA